MSAHCRGCGREIIWAETDSGKRIPLDPEPAVGGNFVLEQAGCSERSLEIFRAHYIAATDPWPGRRYKAHFATCPRAERFRQGRSGGGG